MTDLLGGNADMTFTAAPPLIGHIKTGRLRALAGTSDVALATFPNVPATSSIKGFGKLDLSSWFAVYAPVGTPTPVAKRAGTAGASVGLDVALADDLRPARGFRF